MQALTTNELREVLEDYANILAAAKDDVKDESLNKRMRNGAALRVDVYTKLIKEALAELLARGEVL
jgi:hypothetical protein